MRYLRNDGSVKRKGLNDEKQYFFASVSLDVDCRWPCYAANSRTDNATANTTAGSNKI